ncbi:MAG TPA: DoxX family protein [Candidatus Acidoferrales bacterium]|nr:DoxX family protein [Candidatus Acidoferrales bacterium]
MLKRFFDTKDDMSLLVARLALGIVFFPHGAQKLLGWFGGGGFSGTIGAFTQGGMPWIVALLVILGESLGSISLILGFMSRFCAFGIGSIMLGAIAIVHYRNGFFMNWQGNQQGEGYEYHLLALGLVLALIIGGGGKWSVDRAISQKLGG